MQPSSSSPEAGTPPSPFIVCVQIAFEQCEGNLITFALLMHA
jgi:hypothetical protein